MHFILEKLLLHSHTASTSARDSLLLRYPHVRLAMYNRLIASHDCLSAFAETACELGLCCREDLADLRQEMKRGICGSLAIARKVLEVSAPKHCDKLFHQLVEEVDQYKQKLKKPSCPNAHCGECDGMGPIVMDLLLQLLEKQGVQ